jgi:hypothetical protein
LILLTETKHALNAVNHAGLIWFLDLAVNDKILYLNLTTK